MATKTFEELKQMAIQIRDEKTNKQNTATRIGTQMLEHLNKLEQEYYNKENIETKTGENIAISNNISSSGVYSYKDENIKATINGRKIYTPIKKGIEYKFKIKSIDGGNIIANFMLLRYNEDDYNFQFINTNSEKTLNFIPEEDYYGYYLYYGSSNTATSVQIDFKEYRDIDKELYSEVLGVADNIYPDPYLMSKEDIKFFYGVNKIDIIGNVNFYDGKVTIAPGGFFAVYLDLDKIKYIPTSDYLNGIIKLDAQGTGHGLNIAFDKSQPNIFGHYYSFSSDEKYKGWVSIYNQIGMSSLTNQCRVTFDNRQGTDDIVIHRCLLWKGDDVPVTGLLMKQFLASTNKVNTLISKNYAPYYTEFNLYGGRIVITALDKNKLSFIPNSEYAAYFGYDFYLQDSPFKVGDTINFGVKDCNISGIAGFMSCIFYNNENTEISREQIVLSTNSLLKKIARIPEGTIKVLIRLQIEPGSGGSLSVGDNYLTPYNSNNSYERDSIKSKNTKNASYGVVYVDAIRGNDLNDGLTENTALATFAEAFNKTGIDTTIILIGDTTENLNIKSKTNQRSVRLIGKSGKLNRIICGTKIDDAILVEGTTNVYQKQMSTFTSADRFQLFQHDVFDETTLISENERHPLQRGKTYRCDSTKIIRTNSLDDVKTSEVYKYYYDTESKILYFKIKEGSNLKQNPIYYPKGNGIYGNDGSVLFEVVNVEVWYGVMSLQNCHGGRAVDCAAKYSFGGGAWSWDGSIGLELIRCEATRAFSGTTTGDGFNAHSTTTGSALAKHTTATLIDCWSHDNNDDGYSDHERCETTIIGGLFEYNVKGGLTPSYGAHDKYMGCYVRNNVNGGIYHVGTAEDGGVGGQTECINCISEGNSWNYGVADGTEENPNKLILINCISKKGKEEFKPFSTHDFIEMTNCYDYESTTIKSGATQNITIKNGVLVE